MRVLAVAVIACLALVPRPDQSAAPLLLTVRQANPRGDPADTPSVSMSADGRYVAFVSFARLSAADTDDGPDIYVLDRESGNVSLETAPPAGGVSLSGGASPSISGDGRFLTYEAVDNSSPDGRPRSVVMLRDRLKSTAQMIRGPQPPNGSCGDPRISTDGDRVVFASSATNLTAGPDANGTASDVYVFERETGSIVRASVDSDGRQSPVGASFAPAISGDGRTVAFVSTAPLDGPSAEAARTPPLPAIYLRQLAGGVTTRVDRGIHGALPNGPSYQPSLDGEGRLVVFTSEASNLASRDSNRTADVFLYDRDTRATLLISRSHSGESANGRSNHPAISADGRRVAFQSDASDLTCGRGCTPVKDDVNLVADVFVFDRESGAIQCVSRTRTAWMEPSIGPAIDGSGAVVAFSSRHPIDATDLKADFDLFVRVDPSVRPFAVTRARREP